VSNARSIVSSLELGPFDSVLQALPFHYVYGQSLLTTHALVGGTIVIENRFLYPEVALDTLEKEACTGFAGVPSHFAILLNRSTLAKRRLTALKYVTCAGGALNPEVADRLGDALPGCRIYVMYGATEASARLSCLAPQDLSRKRGSAGQAVPDVDLRILLPDGTEAQAGEVGEIVARGPNIMLGYWGDEDASAAVLDEHGYRTGDLGYLDEDGFLFIVGREREFIKSGAHRVSAKEIEESIFSAGQIHEVAVIGVADELIGERIRAYVVPNDSDQFDVDRLMAELRRTMPPYQVPAEIYGLADLPKTESGKIRKRELVAEYPARKLYPADS
jgi:acyl-CoA synthetase (AMP-forming)/AMP-acid ligase II